MAEETIQSVQEEVPVQPEPAADPAGPDMAAAPAAPAAPDPAASGTSRKGSPLLVFLTVLLILIGIADLALWGVVGYYALQN